MTGIEERPSKRSGKEELRPSGICDWNITHETEVTVDQFGNIFKGKKETITLNPVLCNECRVELLKIQEVSNPQ